MERFLDEQDSPTNSPNVHSLLSGDPKRQCKTPPTSPTQQQLQGNSEPTESITSREASIINNHFVDLAPHLEKDDIDSLVRLAATAKSTSPTAHPNPQGSSNHTAPNS